VLSGNLKGRKKRIEQLKDRLHARTRDYAPFFIGVSAGRLESPIILTDLQQIRRAQLSFMLTHPSQWETDAEAAIE
jgi:hypothetical protein